MLIPRDQPNTSGHALRKTSHEAAWALQKAMLDFDPWKTCLSSCTSSNRWNSNGFKARISAATDLVHKDDWSNHLKQHRVNELFWPTTAAQRVSLYPLQTGHFSKERSSVCIFCGTLWPVFCMFSTSCRHLTEHSPATGLKLWCATNS